MHCRWMFRIWSRFFARVSLPRRSATKPREHESIELHVTYHCEATVPRRVLKKMNNQVGKQHKNDQITTRYNQYARNISIHHNAHEIGSLWNKTKIVQIMTFSGIQCADHRRKSAPGGRSIRTSLAVRMYSIEDETGHDYTSSRTRSMETRKM